MLFIINNVSIFYFFYSYAAVVYIVLQLSVMLHFQASSVMKNLASNTDKGMVLSF